MDSLRIRAKKSLGQNFLIDEEALSDIASSLTIASKNIIEVGPGYGALTDYIIRENPKTLSLVELDEDMVKILEDKFSFGGKIVRGETGKKKTGRHGDAFSMTEQGIGDGKRGMGVRGEDTVGAVMNNSKSMSEASTEGVCLSPDDFDTLVTGSMVKSKKLTLYEQDILTFTPAYSEYSVIANIPYYITSPILFHFLYNLPNPPQEMVIMMQKEVGEKILEGRAKKPHHSYLSLAMELACDDIEMIRHVGRESFDPRPKVDSIVLKFRIKKDRNSLQEKKLLTLWRIVFTHPRKTLLSNLKGSHYDIEQVKKWISECGYDEKVRAEAVKKEDWETYITSFLSSLYTRAVTCISSS